MKPTKDLGYPTEPYGRIPAFHNIEEEAEFWDTHDISEFDGVELKPVRVTVGPEVGNSLILRIPQEDRNNLNRIAQAHGTDVATLVESWLKDRLREELRKSA
jgi:hypothetical protein